MTRLLHYGTSLVFVFACTGLLMAQSGKIKVKPSANQPSMMTQTYETGLDQLPGEYDVSPQQQFNTPNTATRISGEERVGVTVYDLQSNTSVANRLRAYDDGTKVAVWTMGSQQPPSYPDRGTGFNHYDGTDWDPIPNTRLEGLVRTGWPNYVRTDDGTEFICNHVFDNVNSVYNIHYLRRAAGATSWSEGDLPTNTPSGVLWPRMASSGNTLHIIGIASPTFLTGGSIYNGVDGHLLYYRSEDAGATWTVVDGIIPGIDSTAHKQLSADAYGIDADGDNVVIGMFDQLSSIRAHKSTDGGDNWAVTQIWEFPFEPYAIDDGYDTTMIPAYPDPPADPYAILTSDDCGFVMLDNNGMAHLWFGRMYISDEILTDGNFQFYPATSGLVYWNESHGKDSVRIIADVEDINGNDTLDINSTAEIATYFMSLTSMMSAGVDDDNNIFVTYSSIMEADSFFNTNDGQYPRHVYVSASTDGGANWTTPYDIINKDISDEPDFVNEFEGVFPTMAKYVDDNQVYLWYQRDLQPGLSVRGDEDNPTDNDIMFVSLDKTLFGLTTNTKVATEVNLESSVFPNPVMDKIQLEYTLEGAEEVWVRLSNTMGQQVLQINLGDRAEGYQFDQLQVEHLASGVYYVEIQAGNQVGYHKIVKH